MSKVKWLASNIQLFANRNAESEMARHYLSQHGIGFMERFADDKEIISETGYRGPFSSDSDISFANSLQRPLVPSLFFTSGIGKHAYRSIDGIRALVRGYLHRDFMGKRENYWGEMGREGRRITTFYPKITCFDNKKKKIFEGDINQSPYQFKEHLKRHKYDSWHEVSCWRVGSLEDLSKKKENGMIADLETRTLLFPEEIEMLGKGEDVVIEDDFSLYHVTFSLYFNEKGIVHGIYAYMFD